MAKTIDHLNFYMDITPYKVDGMSDTFNTLCVTVAYRKGQGFVAYYHPGWSTSWGGWGCLMIGDNRPLVSGRTTLVKEASRNNAKELSTMIAALELAKDAIRAHFDARRFDEMLSFMGAVCYSGYTPKLQEEAKIFLKAIAATNNPNNNPQTNENMKLNLSNPNVQNAQVNNIAVAAEQYKEEPIQDAVAEEITDEHTEQEASVSVTLKSEVIEQPAVQSSAPTSSLPKVQFSTYKTKRGDTAPQIIGFAGEKDPRWKSHKQAGHKYVSAGWRKDLSGEKIYILLFGVRYMDVAKALCGAYNTSDREAWKRAEDACMAIYEQAQRDGKAKWEAKKAQWKAQADEKKAQKAADEQAKKCYTKEDVAAMLADVLAGKDVPEEIKKLLAA